MNFKFIFLIISAIILGMAIPLVYRHQKIFTLNQSFKSSESLYHRHLPADWLVGSVIDIGPSVQIETRYDTEFQDLKIGATISLGDDIKTAPQSESIATIKFNDLAEFIINSNTRLNFTDTDPKNFLINLNRGGNLEFNITLNDGEFSITSLHLLSQFINAIGTIEIKDDNITIKLTKGSVKLGYNDTGLKTQISEITAPKKIIFNDTQRTVKLKKL